MSDSTISTLFVVISFNHHRNPTQQMILCAYHKLNSERTGNLSVVKHLQNREAELTSSHSNFVSLVSRGIHISLTWRV